MTIYDQILAGSQTYDDSRMYYGCEHPSSTGDTTSELIPKPILMIFCDFTFDRGN